MILPESAPTIITTEKSGNDDSSYDPYFEMKPRRELSDENDDNEENDNED
jgi:hypothetical protein